jgi:hypothetical protein
LKDNLRFSFNAPSGMNPDSPYGEPALLPFPKPFRPCLQYYNLTDTLDLMTERYTGRELEPIVHWFVPNTTPEGGAPDEVREQWMGVPLPVRESNATHSERELVDGYLIGHDVNRPLRAGNIHLNDPNEMVAINLGDAIKALALAGKTDASGWWQHYADVKPPYTGERLMFKKAEGEICSNAAVASEYIWIADFDSL